MDKWDVLIDTPNYEQWVYGVESDDEPIIYNGCYVLDARLSEEATIEQLQITELIGGGVGYESEY